MVVKRETIFITGGTGSVGKSLVKKLAREEVKIIILSRQIKKNKKNITYIKGDLANKNLINKILKNVDVVIHLAACIDASNDKNEFYETNVEGLKNVLSAVNNKKIKKVIYLSTASIFKKSKRPINEKNKKIDHSNNFYLDSKAKALKIIDTYKKIFPIVTIYPPAIIDKNRNDYIKSKGIIKVLWFLAGGIPGGMMGLIGDRKRKINYVLVDDIANGIILVLKKVDKSEDYIFAGENIDIKSYLKKMAKYYHRWYLPIKIPNWLLKIIEKIKIINFDIDNNMGDLTFDISKAVKNLGYKYQKI